MTSKETLLKSGKARKTQLDYIAQCPQIEKPKAVGVARHGPRPVRRQVEQLAPGVGEDCSAFEAGSIAEEQCECERHYGGLDVLAFLVDSAGEMTGLGPG